MLYSSNHMPTVGVKRLTSVVGASAHNTWLAGCTPAPFPSISCIVYCAWLYCCACIIQWMYDYLCTSASDQLSFVYTTGHIY